LSQIGYVNIEETTVGTALGTRPQRRGSANWLIPGAGVIVVAAVAAALWATGALPITGAVETLQGLPLAFLIGAPLALLAVGIPGGMWEWQRVARARLNQRRQERIRRLTPLAMLLGLTPQTLDRTTIATLLALGGDGFPEAMGQVLAAQGYRNVQVIDGPGDHGIDIIGLSPDGKRVVAVQCKCYRDKVAEKELREFLGAAYHDNLQRGTLLGLFFTTSDYKENAKSFAQAHQDPEKRYHVGLRLYDGEQLVDMVRKLAVR
jgi:hypothetical protein